MIDDLNNTTTRLVRLNKNLLVLSKIDSNTYIEIDKVNLKETIDNQLTFLGNKHFQKKLILQPNYQTRL